MKTITNSALSNAVSAVAALILVVSPLTATAADLGSGYGTADYGYTDYGTADYDYGYDYGNPGGITSFPPARAEKPSCTLKANKTTVEKGEQFKLTWTTKNAKKVTLNGNEVRKNNTRVVDGLNESKTWTLVAKGEDGKTVTCKETVKVKLPAPECTLKAVPSKVEHGGSVTVSWTTKNADWVKLNGDAVSKNGSRTFNNLTKNQTYTLTVEGINDKRVTCTDIVEVKPKPPKDVCPNIEGIQTKVPEGYILKDGKCVKKQPPPQDVCPNIEGIQTKVPEGYILKDGKCVKKQPPPQDVCPNIEGIQTKVPEGYILKDGKCVPKTQPPVDICPNIPGIQKTLPHSHKFEDGKCVPIETVINNNNTNVNQNQNTNVNNTTVINYLNEHDECDDCDDDNHDEDFWCRLDASDTHIRPGEKVDIEWESEGAERGYISGGIGWIDEDDLDEGSERVRLYHTTTFTGYFYDEDDDRVRCSTTVYVQDYPGYYPPYPPQTPFVTLTSIPYTGLELGPVGTALYWGFLVLWCLAAAYLIAVKKVHVRMARGMKRFLFGSNEPEAASSSAHTLDIAAIAEVVRAVIEGPQVPAQKSALRTAGAPAHIDHTDEFVLSQIHRK